MINKIKGMVLIVGLVLVVGFFEHSLATYTREATILATYGTYVVAVDTMGNEWGFEADDVEAGDKVELRMFTKHTDSSFYDDEVENYKIIKY